MDQSEISSVEDYLRIVLDEVDGGPVTAYRGHSSNKYKIIPKVFRYDKSKRNEEKILSELLTESPDDFRDDKSVFEQLVRAQHYGLPTRLLDVTLNPLVALWFASQSTNSSDDDGEVIRFNISDDRTKLFDSDALSCAANVARLSYDEKNSLYLFLQEFKGKGGVSMIDIDEFNKRDEIVRLLQFVRVEKPYFQSRLKPIDLTRFFFAYPKRNNKRIISQSGAFIVAGILKSISEERTTAFEVEKIKVTSARKVSILADLDKLNINERTMFPEIENTSRYIAKKFSN